MPRTAVVLALAFAASATAAPVPAPSEKELIATHWGKTEGQGEFSSRASSSRSGHSANRPAGYSTPQRMANLPRATRTVRGDFEITVKVTDAALPNKGAKHEDAWPGTRAGLIVQGGGYGIEWHPGTSTTPNFNGMQNDGCRRCVWVDTWFPGGGAGNQLKTVEDGKSPRGCVTCKEKHGGACRTQFRRGSGGVVSGAGTSTPGSGLPATR